ncbi:MAG TPA: HD domain-containing protein [Clostridiales bacterium]|nr:HD domain-containing protein [Clostridiales bacterium]
MRYINEFREGDNVAGTYLCKSKATLTTRAGKSYYSLVLQDKTGTIDGKVWDLGSGIDHFEAMDYIYIDSQVLSYQGSNQLNIRRIRRSSEGEYYPEDYMPSSDKNIDVMYEELLDHVKNIKDVNLKTLVSKFFVDDKDFIERFKQHSAAKTIHHGFMGGLLEHTLGVVKLCVYYSENYAIINKDLLIAAALFHDIGKMDELSTFPENDYTDEGQLMGHIFIGANQVSDKIKEIDKFPVTLKNELIHCILAHHGELEYGSPKKPAIVEAMVLNFADNADAKIQTMTEMFEAPDSGDDWLGYQRIFESNIRKTSKSK